MSAKLRGGGGVWPTGRSLGACGLDAVLFTISFYINLFYYALQHLNFPLGISELFSCDSREFFSQHLKSY